MNDRERRRVAFHESGHASMAFLLGRAVDVVSIRPSDHSKGVTAHRGPRLTERERGKFGLPARLLPARVRRHLEASALVALAGDLAEQLDTDWEPVSGYIASTPDEQFAEQAAGDLTRMTRKEEARLAATQAKGELGSDAETAWKGAYVLAGAHAGQETIAHVGYLQALARAIVGTAQFARLVGALVPHLLANEVLGGRAVRRILVQANEAPGGKVFP